MGFSTALPLFRITGFGPLGLPLTPQAYGVGTRPLSEPGSPQSGAAGAFLLSGPTQSLVSGFAGGGGNRLFAGSADGTGSRTSSNPVPKAFVLNFVAGESGRAAFALTADQEIVIGRDAGSELVLAVDGVGRRHAKISYSGNRIVLQDLGSVGGTFVNGAKVNSVELKEGDRIMIGKVILRLNAASEEIGAASTHVTSPPPASAKPASQPSQKMSGQIEVIPLPDLLQLMSGARKNGVLVVNSDRGEGKIYLREGRVSYCSINGSTTVNPQKAFYRLLTWSEGVFQLDPPFTGNLPEDINASVESLLMEGVYQSDEIKRIEGDAPAPGAKLKPNLKAGSLSDLSADDRHVLQVVLAYGTLDGVLDHYLGSDLQAYTSLISLISKGFVVAS